MKESAPPTLIFGNRFLRDHILAPGSAPDVRTSPPTTYFLFPAAFRRLRNKSGSSRMFHSFATLNLGTMRVLAILALIGGAAAFAPSPS